MREQTSRMLVSPVVLTGDSQRLAERLGSVEGLTSLAQALVGVCVPCSNGLDDYRDGILLALEWPAILQAHGHVTRNEIKELVTLDRRLGQEARWQEWAAASSRIGQWHLRCLRPLKDHRAIQHYLHEVEAGRAKAWHPLVYGAILAVYSLPLRQALLRYAWIALETRASAEASRAHPTPQSRIRLVQTHFSCLPGALDVLLLNLNAWH